MTKRRNSESQCRADVEKYLIHEVYIHDRACRGLAGKFFREHERRVQGVEGKNVQFRFLDVVYFLAVAAATGVVGNLSYAALKKSVYAIRGAKGELRNARFESVVRASLCSRLRRQRHPRAKASDFVNEKFNEILEKEYGLIVRVVLGHRKK